jgi:hypothetical protein
MWHTLGKTKGADQFSIREKWWAGRSANSYRLYHHPKSVARFRIGHICQSGL